MQSTLTEKELKFWSGQPVTTSDEEEDMEAAGTRPGRPLLRKHPARRGRRAGGTQTVGRRNLAGTHGGGARLEL